MIRSISIPETGDAMTTAILDAKTQAQIERGKRIVEVFKQPPYNPIPVEIQVAVLWAAQNDFVDDVPVEKALAFESALRAYMKSKYGALVDKIESSKDLDADGEKQLSAAIEDFKKNASY